MSCDLNYFLKRVLPILSIVTSLVLMYAFLLRGFTANKASLPTVFPTTWNPAVHVNISLSVLTFDPVAGVISLQIDADVFSFPAGYFDFTRGVMLRNISFVCGQKIVSWPASMPYTPLSCGVPITSGLVSWYPMDSYTVDTVFSVFDEQSTSIALDLGLSVSTANVFGYTFSVSLNPSQTAAVGRWPISFLVSRSTLFRIYPVFVMIALLLFVCVTGSITVALVVFKWRRVEPGLLSMFGLIIFALPALRNSVPLAPPVGSLLDYASFFWSMLIAVVQFCALFLRYSLDRAQLRARKRV